MTLQRAGWHERDLQDMTISQLLRRLEAAKHERANQRAENILDQRAAHGMDADALRDYIDKLQDT